MEGLVLSDEESVKEKLFGFDEAMEVNSNTVVLHCASILTLMPFWLRDFDSKWLSSNRWTGLMIFQIIWKHQNPPDCSKVKFLIIGTYKSGTWLDDGYHMWDCTTKLLFIRQEKLLLETRMRGNVTAVDLKFDWFSSFLDAYSSN